MKAVFFLKLKNFQNVFGDDFQVFSIGNFCYLKSPSYIYT